MAVSAPKIGQRVISAPWPPEVFTEPQLLVPALPPAITGGLVAALQELRSFSRSRPRLPLSPSFPLDPRAPGAPTPPRPARTVLFFTVSLSLASLIDRKSTRLNSSHVATSYAVFCLKKNSNQILR